MTSRSKAFRRPIATLALLSAVAVASPSTAWGADLGTSATAQFGAAATPDSTPTAVSTPGATTTTPNPTPTPTPDATGAPTPTPEPTQSTAPAPSPSSTTAAATQAGSAGTLTYRGLTIAVPGGWSAVDLDSNPTACPRLDVRAVYVGVAAAPLCPTIVAARAGSVSFVPAPSPLPRGTVTLPVGTVPTVSSQQLLAGEVDVALQGTGVLATVYLGSDVGADVAVLAGVGIAAVQRPQARAALAPSLAAAAPTALPMLDASATRYYGDGFDACAAPSLTTMQAWLASPFRSIGVYIGGGLRACAQTNLTAGWVRSVVQMGWHLQATYVGPQAPCSAFSQTITYGQEWTQGRAAALDAIGQAQSLGLGPGSDIYYDMEAYTQSTQCSGSVMAFLSSWTQALQYNGYSSGVYSSLASGISDLAHSTAQPGFVPPNKIWIAHWTSATDPNAKNVYGQTPYVADTQWAPYQRARQYLGGHNETWGGVTINIDSDFQDTDPLRGSPRGQIDAVAPGPSRLALSGWALDPDSSSPVIVQLYVDGGLATMAWANGDRPDVGAAFPASGSAHGYSITVALPPGPHSFCLYAINIGPGANTTLGCRSVTVLSSDPFGQIDSAGGGPSSVIARGWAIDPDVSGPIIVQAYVDGAFATMGWANLARPDVAAAYPSAGAAHGYQLTAAAAPGPHTICLYAVNTGPGSSTALGCRSVTALSSDPFGQIDSAGAAAGTVTATGWAIDPDTASPIIVQAYVDGAFATMGWANLSRPDVATVYPAAGASHGYRLVSAARPGLHTLCLYAVNTGPGSSTSLGCRTIAVP